MPVLVCELAGVDYLGRFAGIFRLCAPPGGLSRKTVGALYTRDRFLIMTYLSKAIDEVHAQEAKQLKKKTYEPIILAKTHWLLLNDRRT
ncbi:MAG: hypothetical protein ACE5GZ_08105 [Gammaproteobacteria bacterium]